MVYDLLTWRMTRKSEQRSGGSSGERLKTWQRSLSGDLWGLSAPFHMTTRSKTQDSFRFSFEKFVGCLNRCWCFFNWIVTQYNAEAMLLNCREYFETVDWRLNQESENYGNWWHCYSRGAQQWQELKGQQSFTVWKGQVRHKTLPPVGLRQ